MSARSLSVSPAVKPITGLRRLRWLCMAVALCCAVALPLELGVVEVPASVASTLHGLPVVGRLFAANPAAPTTVKHHVAPSKVAHHAAPAILSVDNSPRTAVIGHTESFSVRIAGLPHAKLTYVLRYSNGQQERAVVRTNATGFSRHVFTVLGFGQSSFRTVATISVRDASGRLHAMTRFAVQKP
jgi:hypothetical protein